jgi:outer membrane lipoprotein-sorting protein
MTRFGPDQQLLPSAAALLAFCLWLLALPLSSAAAQPGDVKALMSLLRRVHRVELSYQETVESGLIDTPISTRGRMVYEAPDHIRRISDQNEGFVLDGDRMQLIADGRVVKELVVSDIAPLQAMVGALRATFAGDLVKLRADYRMDYRSARGHWTLALEPRSGGLFAMFRRIEMIGDGATISTIVMDEPNGDRRILHMRMLSREPAKLD